MSGFKLIENKVRKSSKFRGVVNYCMHVLALERLQLSSITPIFNTCLIK